MNVIGVDVGGTNTDAVRLADGRIAAWTKVPTRKGGWIYFTATFDRNSMERALVRGTMRLALDLGRAVVRARAAGEDAVDAIAQLAQGRRLFRGKIVALERRFRGGHDWGALQIEGLEGDRGRRAEIAFKNEYLILRIDDRVALTVPDLISVVETPVTTEVVRPGLRVSVLGLPSSPLYHTPDALRVVGPAAFGYDVPFVSL
jgi:DUF917 family protein